MLPPAVTSLTTDPTLLGAGAAAAVAALVVGGGYLTRWTRRRAADRRATAPEPAPVDAPIDWTLAPGMSPASSPATDAAEEPGEDDLLDDLHTHFTGGPASNAALAAHPVTGEVHLRNRRTAPTDANAAPVARAGATPATGEAPLTAEETADETAGEQSVDGFLIPDLAPGSNTSPSVPAAGPADTGALLDRLREAASAGDLDTAAAIARHHPDLAQVAHLVAATIAGTGPAADEHLAAAVALIGHRPADDGGEPVDADEFLTGLRLVIELPASFARVHLPATVHHAILALAARHPADPDSAAAIATAHALEATPTTHLLRLAAALATPADPDRGSGGDVVVVPRAGRWPIAPAVVPADTAEHLRLLEEVPAPRRSRPDGWLVLYAHARAQASDAAAVETFADVLDRYAQDLAEGDPAGVDGQVDLDVTALAAEVCLQRAVLLLQDGQEEEALRQCEVGARLDPTHPGLRNMLTSAPF